MTSDELRKRTKQSALRVIRLVEAMPDTKSARAIGNQLVRSGTAVGANYRSACRARSRAEFAAKIGLVEEEADESAFWMELVIETSLLGEKKVRPLWTEANGLVAIMAASRQTARKHGAAASNRQSAIGNRQ